MLKNDWSDWFNFNEETILKVPVASGVYMMHASTEILFIGGSENLKKSITNALSEKWISKTTRCRYREEKDFEKNKDELIIDFKKRHEGNLPKCMN